MAKRFHAGASSLAFVFVLAPALAAPALAASVVYVANTGLDSGTCGGKTAPCRSITQGIANSAVGGKIVVGPGIYGDINQNGTLGETGEEVPGTCATTSCLIDIDKQVSITSSDGAFATVITPGTALVGTTVGFTADGAAFGAFGKGFTVVGSNNPSSAAILAASPVSGVVVAGNVVTEEGVGGLGIGVTDNGRVVGNRILGTGAYGIYVSGNGALVSGNSVSNWLGGYLIVGNNAVFTGNVANSNIIGLALNGTAFSVANSSFVGNQEVGIEMSAMSTGAITASDFVGNDVNFGCGVNAANSTTTVVGNWWGAATGPGSAPANKACNITVGVDTPFSTVPIKVKLKGIR